MTVIIFLAAIFHNVFRSKCYILHFLRLLIAYQLAMKERNYHSLHQLIPDNRQPSRDSGMANVSTTLAEIYHMLLDIPDPNLSYEKNTNVTIKSAQNGRPVGALWGEGKGRNIQLSYGYDEPCL